MDKHHGHLIAEILFKGIKQHRGLFEKGCRFIHAKRGHAPRKNLIIKRSDRSLWIKQRFGRDPPLFHLKGKFASRHECGGRQIYVVVTYDFFRIDRRIKEQGSAADNLVLVINAIVVEVAEHQQLKVAGWQVQAVKTVESGEMVDVDHLVRLMQTGKCDDGQGVPVEAGAVAYLSINKKIVGAQHMFIDSLAGGAAELRRQSRLLQGAFQIRAAAAPGGEAEQDRHDYKFPQHPPLHYEQLSPGFSFARQLNSRLCFTIGIQFRIFKNESSPGSSLPAGNQPTRRSR